MTVIVALPEPQFGRTWIGSDRMTINCFDRRFALGGGKWVTRAPWAVGVSGAVRTLNLLDHEGDRIFAQANGPMDFTKAARAVLEEHGYKPNDHGSGVLSIKQCLLLARPGRLWEVDGDWSVVKQRPGELWACGSGADNALGVGFALRDQCPWTAREILLVAIDAAKEYDRDCGGEPWIACLTEQGVEVVT